MTWHFDLNAFLIIIFNCAVYAVMYLKKKQDTAVKDYQHNKMWRKYEKEHGINGNSNGG